MADSKAWESWAPKVKVTGKTLPKVKPEQVRKALGAEEIKPIRYDSNKAKAYLLRLAADFIEDNEFLLEAMEISMVALSPLKLSRENFIDILMLRLEWDQSFVDEALKRVSE